MAVGLAIKQVKTYAVTETSACDRCKWCRNQRHCDRDKHQCCDYCEGCWDNYNGVCMKERCGWDD